MIVRVLFCMLVAKFGNHYKFTGKNVKIMLATYENAEILRLKTNIRYQICFLEIEE